MGYREKSIWGTLITSLLFCGWMAVRSWQQHLTIASIIGTIITVIIVQIIVSIVVALSSRREPVDERDRTIAYKSFQAAYWVLFTFGFAWVGAEQLFGVSDITHIPMAVVFLIILGFAEIVRLSVQLVMYRTGAGL